MSYWFSGHWFGGSSSGVPVPSTTDASVSSLREHIINLIEAIHPAVLAGDRFRSYRNEGAGNFERWAEEDGKANAWRRFQVRDDGSYRPPAVTNSDRELQDVWFDVLVAYPQNHRAGSLGALSRDDAMRSDQLLIETAIGVRGRSNFTAPYPIASWAEADETRRIRGDGVDFLMIRQRMIFYTDV